jgi:hypothetical protein
MGTSYASFCDDWYINLRLGTQMPLPQERETVLHFCQRIKKEFPHMSRFRRSDAGEINLEEDRTADSHRWLSFEPKRLACGHVNPTDVEGALRLHNTVIDLAPAFLGLTTLEIEHVDIVLGFDLTCQQNHDEVLAESLLSDSPLLSVATEADTSVLEVCPSITFTVSPDRLTQARIDIVPRSPQPMGRSGEFPEDTISVYLAVRRYVHGNEANALMVGPGGGITAGSGSGDSGRGDSSLRPLLADLADRCNLLASRHVVPKIVQPIASTIARRS